MDFLLTFGDRLKGLRLSKNMSKAEFEKCCDLSRGSVYMYEKGSRYPDGYSVAKICRGLNVSADWLLGLKEDQK